MPSHRMLLAPEAVPRHALLLDRADHALDQAVLLRTVRRDELLVEAVAAHQTRLVATGEHQAVVRPQQEWPRHPAQRAVPRDQCLLERRADCRRLATARQVPAEQLARVAIDHQGQNQPTILAALHSAQVGLQGRVAEEDVQRIT